MRLFIALCLDPELQAEAVRQATRLRNADLERAVRWVDDSSIHLTLQFLGEVPEATVPSVAAALDAALAPLAAPRLALAGPGAFPSAARARVLWIGVHDPGAGVAVLHRAVGAALAPLGWEPDPRPFEPHLTVGRVREGMRLGRGLRAVLGVAPAASASGRPQTDVALFRSHLGAGPVRYERLRTWQLQGAR